MVILSMHAMLLEVTSFCEHMINCSLCPVTLGFGGILAQLYHAHVASEIVV